MGEVSFAVEAVEVKAALGATGLDISAFAVQVLKSSGEVVKEWDRFDKVPDKVKLLAGDYILSASYGSQTASGFDAAYYSGTKAFTVKRKGANTNVEVVCKLSNVRVAVVYGGNIALEHSDWYMDVSAPGGDPVRFMKDEQRTAYFPEGKLKLKIFLTKDGKTRSYIPDPVEAVGNDFVKLDIDMNEVTGNMGLNISINPDTEGGEEFDLELPPFMLDKAAPQLEFQGFDAVTGALTFAEGDDVAARINLRADAGIRECVVEVNSPALTALGWPAKFDFANMDPQTADVLRKSGLKWFSNMNGSVFSYIDFTDLRTTGIGDISSAFKIEVSDSFSQSSSQKTFSLNVLKPVFDLSEIRSGDMWATKADINVSMTVGNMRRLAVERRTASTDWAQCELADMVDENGTIKAAVKGLAPSTGYTVRLKYNDHVSAERTVVTEATPQIPNGDFEQCYEYKVSGKEDINLYHWSQQSEVYPDRWWSTRNPASGGQLTGSSIGGKNDYTRNNGSMPVNTDTGRGVLLETTAWGRGNTSTINGGGTKYNITAAVLFIGGYSFELKEEGGKYLPGNGKMTSETITQGHAFTSRPAAVTVDYKYEPLNGESFSAYAVIENRDNGTVVLGRAEVPASVASQAVGSMTHLSMPVVYDPQYKHLKATHISVFFGSSTKMGWLDGSDRPSTTNSGAGFSKHYGSRLTIDNLNLDYNF